MSEKSRDVLADTCVWIEFFKQGSATGNRLESLLIENTVWTCGIVMFELLQGVKSDKEKGVILESLSTLNYAEMNPALWQKAASISASLRKKGTVLPFSDILISSIAIENNLSIFTLDNHFKRIPGITVYKL